MTRIGFGSLVCAMALTLPAVAQNFDVIVVGATTGGVAAAIAAGRQGMKVALIEDSPVLGGIMANGLSRTDGSPAACTGIYEEFRQRCARYYTTNLPDDPAVKGTKPELLGHRYEPHVADLIFKQMVAEIPGIQVFYRRYATKVLKQGNRVTGVATLDSGDRNPMTFHAAITIDGTHEGDLLPLAGAEFRVGREARSPEEPHAGAIYMTHSGDSFGSGAGDNKLQAYAMLLTIKDYGAGADKTIPKPPNYDPKNYAPEQRKDTWWSGAVLPNRKYELNENMDGTDFTEINWGWLDAGRAGRRRIWEKYRDLTLGYVYFRQTVMGEKNIGLTEDEFNDNGHFPYELYVREGRRLVGNYILDERDCVRQPGLQRPPFHKDSIAVGDWAIDSHAVSRDTEGYIYLGMSDRFHVAAPVQAPYGIMAPREIDGLLVPMAVSSTHIGFQVLRLEPIRTAMGEAAGNAAALCVKARIQPRNVNVEQLQKLLIEQGQSLFFYKDVLPSNPHFKAIQRIAMKQIDSGYDDFTFRPEHDASYGDAAKYLFNALGLHVKMDVSDMWKIMSWQEGRGKSGVQHCTPEHWATYYLLTLRNLDAFDDAMLREMNPDAPISRSTLMDWMSKLKVQQRVNGTGTITRGELAEIFASSGASSDTRR
jgi:hypothetical protein